MHGLPILVSEWERKTKYSWSQDGTMFYLQRKETATSAPTVWVPHGSLSPPHSVLKFTHFINLPSYEALTPCPWSLKYQSWGCACGPLIFKQNKRALIEQGIRKDTPTQGDKSGTGCCSLCLLANNCFRLLTHSYSAP